MKAARQDIKRHQRNVSAKHVIATVVKKAITSIATGNKKQAELDFKAAQEAIDSACSRGILHRNTAARKISRIAKKTAKVA
jgi:small subunit ribosomal protein S20